MARQPKNEKNNADSVLLSIESERMFNRQYKHIQLKGNKKKANSLDSFKKLNRCIIPINANDYLYDIETLGD